MKWDRISVLIDRIKDDLLREGYAYPIVLLRCLRCHDLLGTST